MESNLAQQVLGGLTAQVYRRRRWRCGQAPPWTMTLLVHADDAAGLLRPSVQLLGPPLPGGRVRLELRDGEGVLHPRPATPLPHSAIGSELSLPPFAPSDGASLEEAAGWAWTVVLGDSRRERARWTRRLVEAGLVNVEAELELLRPHDRGPTAGSMLYISEGAEAVNGDSEWWQTPYGRWRLAAEVAAMRRFPGFRAYHADEEGLSWRGWLESSLPPGNRYLVEVAYPDGFPDEAPEVAILRPEIAPETPHFLFGRRPCLYRSSGHGYDAARTTAATIVAWTALWIHAYETWRATGGWPGAEA